jgi:hypothetical protein
MGVKRLTIYSMPDASSPTGKVYHVNGPVIKEAIKRGAKINNADLWDYTGKELLDDLKKKGVKI